MQRSELVWCDIANLRLRSRFRPSFPRRRETRDSMLAHVFGLGSRLRGNYMPEKLSSRLTRINADFSGERNICVSLRASAANLRK